MLNRREVLGTGLAVSALSGLPAGVVFSSALRFRAGTVLVDRRLPDVSEMTARFGYESAQPHVFAGDPGPLWMNVIEPALRSRPAAIAGYTSVATLFCFQYLSQSYGLRLAAYAAGAATMDRIDAGASELLDLRDPRRGNPDAAVTWVLAPKRG
jgi:hypothetical protein